MLSALAAREPVRRAHSLLLLQPAVNHLCFAPQGGYRPVLGRTTRPVFTTYSAHDVALTRFFHLAVRREADRYEPRIAAWPEPPSPYAALGGYGPREAEDLTQHVALQPAGAPTRSTRRSRSRPSTRPTASRATARSATPAPGGR